MMSFCKRKLAGSILAAAVSVAPAYAQDDAGRLSLELNGLAASDSGCRLTFVVENGLGADLSRAAFELVLFDQNGLVERLTIVDFLDLPDGKTKVRQFEFRDANCDDIGRVLINNATECTGDGIDPATCIRQLDTSSQGDIDFGS